MHSSFEFRISNKYSTISYWPVLHAIKKQVSSFWFLARMSSKGKWFLRMFSMISLNSLKFLWMQAKWRIVLLEQFIPFRNLFRLFLLNSIKYLSTCFWLYSMQSSNSLISILAVFIWRSMKIFKQPILPFLFKKNKIWILIWQFQYKEKMILKSKYFVEKKNFFCENFFDFTGKFTH